MTDADRPCGDRGARSGAGPGDEELMGRVAGGDRDAFACLVRKYQGPLMNFFYRMSVYSGDRDDLVQETFIRLFNYRDRYRPTARFAAFVYMIARQVQVDYYRKQQRRAALAEAVRNEPVVEQLDRSDAEGRRIRVEKALGRLSDEMRSVLVLSIYQELRYAEIAEVLDIPLGTVKTRVFHALQKLRKILSSEE